jgi:uncharacterized protein (DUF58 family)
MRPTRRAALLFSGLLPLPWLLLIWQPGLWRWSLAAGTLALAAMAVDAVLARPWQRLLLRVDTPEAAFLGEEIPAEVTLESQGRQPAQYDLALDVAGDALPLLDINPCAIAGSAGGTSVSIRPRRRGMALLECAWVRWRGPLGLMEPTRRFPLDRQVAVLPGAHAARGDALAVYFRDALFGVKVQRGRGEGSEFEALTEYAPGQDSRFLDWKHSARHRKLLVREFRVERNHPIVLAFDTGHLMREPVDGIPRLDHSIGAGLLLARIALGAGDLVGAYSFDSRMRQYLPAARGVQAFRRLQHHSASLAYTAEETNFTIGLGELQSRLPRRTLIVLFTDFVDTVTAELLVDNTRRLNSRHLLVFVTVRDGLLPSIFRAYPEDGRRVARAVLAADSLRDRSVVFERLQRLGIHCIEAAPAELSPALLNHYLRIKQRGLL